MSKSNNKVQFRTYESVIYYHTRVIIHGNCERMMVGSVYPQGYIIIWQDTATASSYRSLKAPPTYKRYKGDGGIILNQKLSSSVC